MDYCLYELHEILAIWWYRKFFFWPFAPKSIRVSLWHNPKKTLCHRLILIENGWNGQTFYGTAILGDCSRNDEKWEKRWISHNQQRFAVISSELSLQIGCSNVMIVNLSVSYDFACEVCGGLCHFWIFLEILVVRSQEHWPRLLASIPTTILFFECCIPLRSL